MNRLPRGSYGIPLRSNTVNSENFARVVFSRNFAKIRPSRNVKQSFFFTDVGKSCQRHDKKFAKISKFTLMDRISPIASLAGV